MTEDAITSLLKAQQALEEKYQAQLKELREQLAEYYAEVAIVLSTAEPTYEESLESEKRLKALQERVAILLKHEEK